ncbi:hypothetical protein BN11_1880012 [Nostocoides australiense Ben110]|uniref:Uncharacterized protein n=1 Tax=Nostocoides australiense Ben110 TaxID=1193182 RepID=W6JTM7_9MICO|nr:hypothetical protein BN11_1880012 [Tetrasphaera australiensis Ben110]
MLTALDGSAARLGAAYAPLS